jgi:hypothetical protein
MCSESGHWTYETLRTPVKEPTAGERNDLTLASSSDNNILFWCNKGYKIFRWVAYFEIGVGFGSAVARFST